MSHVAKSAFALALASAFLLLACAEPECAYDEDCGAGNACVDGACQPLELGGVGQGECAADADCSAGERCVEGRCEEPVLVQPCSGELDARCTAEGKLCTVDLAQVCEEAGCVLDHVCRPPVGTQLGGYGCGAHDECLSGVCAAGTCVRACTTDAECSPTFGCRERALDDGRKVRMCVGVEDGVDTPGRRLCRGDRDCPEDRSCRFLQAAPELDGGVEHPVCELPPEGTKPWLALCSVAGGGPECTGGLCRYSCQTDTDVCHVYRCTGPCEDTADCPPRFACQATAEGYTLEGRLVKYCSLTLEGCYDDVDCCPSRDAEGRCLRAWVADETHCTLVIAGAELYTRCAPQLDKARPGEACAAADDCTTNLCVSGAAGSFCSTPCDGDPARDRCEQTLPGTTCRPLDVAVGGTTVSLPVCQ